MAASEMNVKLLIDTRSQRVLFAEAGKDFVDFVFTLLPLPLGMVTRLLSNDTMTGCLPKLYKSIENLGDIYMQPNVGKDSLLNPRPLLGSSTAEMVPLLLAHGLASTLTSMPEKIYLCGGQYGHPSVADDPRAICPHCNNTMSREATYVAPPSGSKKEESMEPGEGGYVKRVVTYTVMDDLEVKPMSTIALLKCLNNVEIDTLEQRLVTLTKAKGLELLKASLETNKVLTTVFLKSTIDLQINNAIRNDPTEL